MKAVTVKRGQNIIDIAVQEYGKAESVSLIIEDNPKLLNDYPGGYLINDASEFDFAHSIKEGTKLNIRIDPDEINKGVLRELDGRKIISYVENY